VSDDTLLRLEQEVTALKRASIVPTQPVQSVPVTEGLLVQELQTVKAELTFLRGEMQAIRKNEERMERQLEQSQGVLNPNVEYIEEIGDLISPEKNGQPGSDHPKSEGAAGCEQGVSKVTRSSNWSVC
jgi:hypothetical protein